MTETPVTKDKRRGSLWTESNVSSPRSEPPPGIFARRWSLGQNLQPEEIAVVGSLSPVRCVKHSSPWCDCTTSSMTSFTNSIRSQLHFDLVTFGPSKSPLGTKATDFRCLCNRSTKRWLPSTSSPSTKRQLMCSAARLRRRASLQL